jgi:restriction endonuclease S subunit
MRDGWVETPIGDVAQVLSGFAFKSELFNKSEGIPLIRIRDLPKRESTEALYSGSYEDRYVVKKGDYLIGMDGEFHCYEWNGPDALLNQRVCRIQDFKIGRVVPRYIYFAVNQYLDKIEQDTGYTTVKHISAKQVLGITIPLPPLPEQKRIVDLISSVDSYIEALQQQLESAKRSRNAVLHELLTAGGDDWEQSSLGKLLTLEYGKPLTDENRDGMGFPVFASAGVVGLHSEPLVSNSPVIVVGRKGTAGAVHWSSTPCFVIDTAYFVRPISDIDLRFLYLLLGFIDLKSVTAQTGVPGLNRDRAYSLKCNIPPKSEQLEVVAIVTQLDDFIHSTQETINRSQDLRSGLLSDLLSGEHEIPVTYDKVMGAA